MVWMSFLTELDQPLPLHSEDQQESLKIGNTGFQALYCW
uniref:Uncharacterized protein n=1 Tax=Zea mays TaxID=4577 RepID=C4J4H1_MAIZE|nr:unknown [Zea mays]